MLRSYAAVLFKKQKTVIDDTAKVFQVSGLKDGTTAYLFANGVQIAMTTVNSSGVATWNLPVKPAANALITYVGSISGILGVVDPAIPEDNAAFKLRGINFAGMEYGSPSVNLPDVANGWNKPTDASFTYYASRGFNLVRIPYLIERCQPGGPNTALGSDTNSTNYMAALVDLGNKARAAGMTVMWDAHNYGKIRLASDNYATEYYVGTSQFPVAALADFHVRFSQYTNLVKPTDHIDLMNEPTTSANYNGASAVTDQINWVNAAIASLRNANVANVIHVPGMAYSQASGWKFHGSDLLAAGVIDPNDNWMMHLHQYCDQNQSGSQDNTFYGIWPAKLLREAREDAIKKGYRLFLGEFNATYSTNSSQDTVNAGRNALHEYLQEMSAYPDVWYGFSAWRGGGRVGGNDITALDAWSGGWTSPNNDLQPANGNERDKITIIKRYNGEKVADLLGSTIDLDIARGFYKGGALDDFLKVTRGIRPGTEEDGSTITFGANVLRKTRRGLKIDPSVVNDNIITTQDITNPAWTNGNPNGNRLIISSYLDPDDGKTYTRIQMTGDYNTNIRFIVNHAAPARQSVEIKTLGSANQYVGFYGGGGSFGDKDINIDGTNASFTKNKWFRADWGSNANWGFHLLNRSVATDILIRNMKINLGSAPTPYADANYDGDQVNFSGALLNGISSGDFTILIQTRALDASGLVLPILGGVVGGSSVSLLQRDASGALSTGLGGSLATATQSLVQWSESGIEYGSRRVALSVRRSGTPRVVIGATGAASVGANQSAGVITAATLGRLDAAFLAGLIERVTLYSEFRDTAAVNALVA